MKFDFWFSFWFTIPFMMIALFNPPWWVIGLLILFLIMLSFDPPILLNRFHRFSRQNYNEFRDVRWHDYISLIVDEFPILLIRRYDFGLHAEKMETIHVVQILGFNVLKVW
jgi:hypothetical protein